MPQALAAAVVAAVGVTGTAATIATAALALGFTYGLSQIAKPKSPKPSDGQIIRRESVGGRWRHYGMVMTGGTLAFHDSREGTLGYVLATGHGEIDGYVEHRINNVPVTPGAGGVVSEAKFQGKLRLLTRTGTASQTAIGEFSTAFPDWTADHRMRGCSALALLAAPVKQKHFAEVYDSREPEWAGVLRGAKLYDPRLDGTLPFGAGPMRQNDPSTWAWSDNAALVIADFVAHADGFARGMAGVNWANIAEEADLADEDVTTVDARTIKRWRLWGSYNLAEQERRQILADMLAACDAESFDGPDGTFNLRLGRWIAPTVTLTDDHILAYDTAQGVPGLDAAGAIKAIFTDAAADYGEQAAAPYPSANDVDSTVESLPLYWCPDHNQAVRVAKRRYREKGDRWQFSMVTNLYGLNAIGERIITVDSEEFGQGPMPCLVKGLTFYPVTNRVELTLIEVAADDWDFDALTEEGDPPVVDTATPAAITVPAPTGLALAAVPLALGGTNGVGIVASWDTADRDGLVYAAEVQPDGETGWTPMVVNDDERTAATGLVASGVAHDVRVKAITISGRESAWSAVESITPTADNSGVSAPSLVTATGGVAQVVLGWRNPFEAAFDHVEIWHNTSNAVGGAAQVGPDQIGATGEVMGWTHSTSAGPHYYWIRAYNAAGGFAAAAVVSATAT